MFGETLRETPRPFDLPDGVAAMLKREADCDISPVAASRTCTTGTTTTRTTPSPTHPPTHPTQQKNQTIPFC